MGTPAKDLPFPLSKIMDDLDTFTLERERDTILRYNALEGQHQARWWEYAMAHKAIGQWAQAKTLPAAVQAASTYQQTGSTQVVSLDPLQLCDVGGAGSRFVYSLTALTSEDITLIDPGVTWETPRGPIYPFAETVEQHAAATSHDRFDCLTAISVIEHLDQIRPFLRACRMLLKTGGLLFLTTDCWNLDGEDVAHFHWMRKRIYNPETMRRLANTARDLGFGGFGRTDWTYHGNTVFDYSFASLALVKK